MNRITGSHLTPTGNKVFTLASPEDWRLSVKVYVDASGIAHSTVMIDEKFALYKHQSWITVEEKAWTEIHVKEAADHAMSAFSQRLRDVLQP